MFTPDTGWGQGRAGQGRAGQGRAGQGVAVPGVVFVPPVTSDVKDDPG